MPEQPIPFGNKEGSGLSELGGASPLSFNVVTDGVGAVRRRPGLRARDGVASTAIASTAITGVWVAQDGTIYAVDDGAVRHIYKVAGAATNLTTDDPFLLGDRRPQFAETEALLVVAGGKQALKVELGSGKVSLLADTATPSDPPHPTHIVANQSRLVANDLNHVTFLRFSDQAAGSSFAGHEYWLLAGIGTSGFVSADARADPIVAVHDNTNEIFVFGSQTLQVFAPDGLSVYAPSATRQVGCIAPNSVVQNDQSFMWLNEFRHFVRSDGRSFEVLSDPIAQTLKDLTRVDDCFGYRFNEGWADVMVWTFPTDGLTFAYQESVGWSRWAGWNGNWTAFPVASKQPSMKSSIVGLNDGRIGELANRCLTDYGSAIRAYSETGYLNRGTDARKQCESVRLGLRRGKTDASTEPQANLYYSDRPGHRSDPIPIRLGLGGDTDIVVTLRSLGVYRRRKWIFEFTGTDELVLASATESFNVLSD